MNNKLLDDARAAGFDVDNHDMKIRLQGHQYLSIFNSDISDKLAKFAELQQPQWISVDNELPINSNIIDIRIKLVDGSELNVWAQSDGDYYFISGGSEVSINGNLVTHWQPLPSLPINTKGE